MLPVEPKITIRFTTGSLACIFAGPLMFCVVLPYGNIDQFSIFVENCI